MQANAAEGIRVGAASSQNEVWFALGVVLMLTVLFIPLPAVMIDLGLAASIAAAVLILMVALWVQRPLEFSSFPTILLIVTMLRLALNVATTRLILAEGAHGPTSAGHVISGFANLVMGGDFVIGLVVFLILLTVNFIVITKGASRIAEVGARFALDGIPGKQMAIDADLSAGLIDEKEAQRRRRELDEESSFFGAMDGASKFVRGDAIAGLIILSINVVGGILIGTLRQGMPLAAAADTFIRLAVGDGLVSQMPALIISLAAGLVVAKGGARGSVERAVFGQLGRHPSALIVTGGLMGLLALTPGLPFLPFAALGVGAAAVGYVIVQERRNAQLAEEAEVRHRQEQNAQDSGQIVRSALRTNDIEVALGSQLSSVFLKQQEELSQRVAKIRRKFASKFGFVVPEIQLLDDQSLAPKAYQIRVQGAIVATYELSIGDVLVIKGDGPSPTIPGVVTREPAFGLKALWISETFAKELRREGFTPVDSITVMLTHLSEAIRSHLSELFSYRDLHQLLDSMTPEYRKLLDEVRPSHISNAGILMVLKRLLAERVSIKNIHLILEGIATIAPHSRQVEQITEHVRQRISNQLCSDLLNGGALNLVGLGGQWDLAFQESIRRDQKGEAVDFDMAPRLIEEFTQKIKKAVEAQHEKGEQLILLTTAEARPFVRMIVERLPSAPVVLSHAEIARGVTVKMVGTLA